MTFSNKGGGGVHILDSDGKMFPKKIVCIFFLLLWDMISK